MAMAMVVLLATVSPLELLLEAQFLFSLSISSAVGGIGSPTS